MADAPSLTDALEQPGCPTCGSKRSHGGRCLGCGRLLAVAARPMRDISEAIDAACAKVEVTLEEVRRVAENLNIILDRLVRILPQAKAVGDVWVDRNSLETGGDDGQ